MTFYKGSYSSPLLVTMLAIEPSYLNAIDLNRPKGQTYTNNTSLLRSIIRGSSQRMIPLY